MTYAPNTQYYDGPRPWGEDTARYKIRESVLFTVYALYSVFVIATLGLFIIKSRNRHSGLSRRSVRLVTVQTIGCFIVGTNGLVSTAMNRWPCFVKLWLFNVGFLLTIAAISARAVQLIVTSKIHSLNSQLTSKDSDDTQAISANGVLEQAGAHDVYLGLGMPGSFSGSVDGSSMMGHGRFGRMDAPADQTRLTIVGSHTDQGILREHKSDSPIVHAPTLTSDSDACAELKRELQRYTRFSSYVTDRAMLIYIAIALVVAVGISLAINIVNTHFRLSPVSVYCPIVWGFLPVSSIVMFYLVVICPALLALVWKLNDAYGIRTDLIVCDTVGLVATVFTILWETVLHDISWAWSGHFFMWVAVFAIHITSVVVPLAHAIKHSRAVALKIHRASLPESIRTAVRPSGENSRSNTNGSGRRSDFNRMLGDRLEYHQFRVFAAACFCSELTAFIDEYQSLKVQTIAVFDHNQGYYTDNISDPLRAPLLHGSNERAHESFSDLPMSPASNVALLPSGNSSEFLVEDKQTRAQTSAAVSILDTARAVYPQCQLSERTSFPPAMMDKLVSIFSVYINSTSHTAVNVPAIMVRRIREKLNRREMSLTILDEVKDEVLFMLFADIYTRYTKDR
ncbi:hypothetical protein GQ54DRAFT_297576 [Martensiomyces pterosporus]|nr:hypothetical protein GQ54DRAFT_297576 [Martensiomyces pterosporus]